MMASTASTVDISTIASQAVGGGVAGAVVAAVRWSDQK
jgi:hypothetical protein